MQKILVIGATSAIAAQMVKRFALRGDRLFLLGRSKDKLQQLSDMCAELAVAPVGLLAADFNDTEQAPVLVQQAFDALGGIDIVLIAHGFIGDQLRSEEDYDHAELIIKSNFLSAVAFLIPLGQLMEKQGYGKIAVMASVAGDRGRPRNYTYGVAKGALNLYLQGLRSKLWKSGVEVYSFKLGPVVTPMTVDHEKNFSFSSIDAVANIMLATLDSKRYTRYVPGFWFWVMLLVRWLPESVFQKLKFLSGR
jgi:short-subunit dehydrogenase